MGTRARRATEPAPADAGPFLTLGQAAKLVGVSERALRKRVYKGTLPTRREVRGGRAVVVVSSADLGRLFPEAVPALEGPDPSGAPAAIARRAAVAGPSAAGGPERRAAPAGERRPRRKADLQRLAAERARRREAEREAAELRGRVAATASEVERLQSELSGERRAVHAAQEDRSHLERALGEAQERVRHLEERLARASAGLPEGASAAEVDAATRRWRRAAWIAGGVAVVLCAWILGQGIAAWRSAPPDSTASAALEGRAG